MQVQPRIFHTSTEKLPSVQAAAKLLVGHWYQNREAVGERLEAQPMAVRALLEPLRNA